MQVLGLDSETAALRVSQVVETYLLRSLHDVVYPWLLRRCARDEKRFLDALRDARTGRRRDVKVPKYACDLDADTRAAADGLKRATSPLDKLLSMKRVTAELTRDVDRTYQRRLILRDSGVPPPPSPELATDDLIDLIVHLFISHRDASSIPNLPTDLKYIQMFHFVEVSTSALGFFLSNFEVACDFLLDRDGLATRPPRSPTLLAPEPDRPDQVLAASKRSIEKTDALLSRAKARPPPPPPPPSRPSNAPPSQEGSFAADPWVAKIISRMTPVWASLNIKFLRHAINTDRTWAL